MNGLRILRRLIEGSADEQGMAKELEKARVEVGKIESQLSKSSFVERAPKEVVEGIRRRLADYQDQASKLSESLTRLT